METYQQTKAQKLKRFGKECWRVLKIIKKPSMQEYKTIVKVSALGMVWIDLILRGR